MSEKPKHLFTIMSDDIREEKRETTTLVGIYSEDIIFERLPATLLKLCFFTRVTGGDGEFKIRLSLMDPNGTEMLNFNNNGNLQIKHKINNINVATPPLAVQEEGEYVYRIFLDETEFCAYRFDIKVRKLQ